MNRHQRGVQPPGRRLRGHDTDARGRGHPRQPGDVRHDRGYRDAQKGIPPNPGSERHRLTTPTGRHLHGIDPGSGAYLEGARRTASTAEVVEDKGVGKASVKVEHVYALLDPRRKALRADQLVNNSVAPRTRAEEALKGVIAEFADAQTQSSVPVPAPVLDAKPAEPAPKKKRLLRLEERREARVRAAADGGGDSGSAEP